MSEAEPPENDRQFDDPLARMIAELDQALAMAGQVARLVHGHYEAFKAEGLNDREALYAAIAWVRGLGEPPA